MCASCALTAWTDPPVEAEPLLSVSILTPFAFAFAFARIFGIVTVIDGSIG